jgi:hypothetical protein
MTYIRKPKPPKPELIERECLKCGWKFIAKGRFNRICPSCAKVNAEMADVYVQYKFNRQSIGI